MRKVKISKKDVMFSADEFYTVRKAKLDNELIKLGILFVIIASVVGITCL